MWQGRGCRGSRARTAARTKNLQFQCSGTDTVIDIDREEDNKQTETEGEGKGERGSGRASAAWGCDNVYRNHTKNRRRWAKVFHRSQRQRFSANFLASFCLMFFPSLSLSASRRRRVGAGVWQGATDVVIEFASSSIKWRKLLACGIELGGVACAFFICLSHCSIQVQFAPFNPNRHAHRPHVQATLQYRCLALFAAGPLFLTVCEMKVTCHGVAKKREREMERGERR